MNKQLRSRRQLGFTIVELLIVIVVIGILAAITIIAFNGVQDKAKIGVIKGDLTNDAKVLALDNVANGQYPQTTAAANNGKGIKASGSGVLEYRNDTSVASSLSSFCLNETDGTNGYYVTSASSVAVQGTACPVTVSTIANSGQVFSPFGVAFDSSDIMYVVDASNRVLKVDRLGNTTVLAGSGGAGFVNNTGTAAQFSSPIGVAVDKTNGTVYVSEQNNYSVRKITAAGVVTTLAGGTQGTNDGTGTAAQFSQPLGLAVDSSGNVFVADGGSTHKIRKITPAGVVTSFAGSGIGYVDGTGTSAKFYNPTGMAIDSSNNLYVGDTSNHRIRKITPGGVVTTVAGTGGNGNTDGANATFSQPAGLAVDVYGNIYNIDGGTQLVRKTSPSGVVTTIAGISGSTGTTDGAGLSARFNNPRYIAIDAGGVLYVTDTANSSIRKLK